MVNVAIIGAGQSGAQLALGLLRHGHEVTLVSDRSPADMRTGRVSSSQCMFDSALATEADLDIDHWATECPAIKGLKFTITGGDAFSWVAPLKAPARSVDQRLKCAAWAERVVERGGELVIREANVSVLEEYARSHDLVVVATGRAELSRLFPPDRQRSHHDRPQRALALTYVRGMRPRDEASVGFTLIPGVGEYFTCPALTTSGPCDVMVLEGVPGGPMDRWDDVRTPEQHLARSLELLAAYVPAEYERCSDVVLTDDGGVLRGRVTPQVRMPVATLPSGRPVLGMGDALVFNDPITAQGSNLAAHAASYYLDSIISNDTATFDVEWMERTFERFWRGWAQWTVDWTTSMLAPPPDHRVALLREATEMAELAEAIANGFDDPRQFFRWWFDEDASARFRSNMRTHRKPRFDPRAYRNALGQYATGVAVVTARSSEGQKVGMTVNSFTSVSMDPPTVLWCPSKNAPSLPAFAEATHFTINVLAADQEHLSRQFATAAPDKFATIELVEGKGGSLVIPGSVAQLECRTVNSIDVGDHYVIFGEVESYHADGGDPLLFHAGAIQRLQLTSCFNSRVKSLFS